MGIKIAVCISGRGRNLKAILEMAKNNQALVQVACVLSDKPDAPGLAFAREASIPTVIVERQKGSKTKAQFTTDLCRALDAHKVDYVVLAGFMQVLSSKFISKFESRILNIHPSLLPAFKGLHPQQQALDAQVKTSGCTVHIVTEEVDAGPILTQATVPVFETDSAETLSQRILEAELKLYPATILGLATGQILLSQTDRGVSVMVNPSFKS